MHQINFKLLLLCLFIALNTNTNAQTAKPTRTALDFKTAIDKPGKKILLEFDFPKEEDVLILVTDSAGITIFLDNKHRFKGKYSRTIDLPGKAPFNLNISRINENINRRIDLR